MTPVLLEPAFIEGRLGRLFVLLRRPVGRSQAPCVLIAPPFAEELNKTRPMLTQVAQLLAARGVATVLPDLYGTGDSAGEFRECDWEVWKDDLLRTMNWAGEQGCAVSGLLGVRLGCVLAAEAVAKLAMPVRRSVFWQPVLDGERFITQFLRLRVAASMMEDRKETVSGLRERLRAGETLEVAGYELSSRIVGQIAAVRLGSPTTDRLGRLFWIEVVRGDDGALPTASLQAMEMLRRSLASVEGDPVPGEAFWSSTEIVRIPALVARTVDALADVA